MAECSRYSLRLPAENRYITIQDLAELCCPYQKGTRNIYSCNRLDAMMAYLKHGNRPAAGAAGTLESRDLDGNASISGDGNTGHGDFTIKFMI